MRSSSKFIFNLLEVFEKYNKSITFEAKILAKYFHF